MRVKFSPKKIFLLIALLLTFAVCAAAYLVSEDQFANHVTQNYAQNMNDYANSLAPEYFDLGTNIPLRNYSTESRNYIDGLLRNTNIQSAKLTDANGLVISSSETDELNTSLLGNADWNRSLSGESQATELNKTEKTVTLYLPLLSPQGNVKGVVVLDSHFPEELLAIKEFTYSVLYVVLGTSLIFVLISYLTLSELEDKMEAKERSISDQSRAQGEEKQLYEAITSSIAEALIVINKNQQIVMMNPEAERLTGQKSSAVEYRSYEKLINFYDENGKRIKKDPIAQGLDKGALVHLSSKDGYHLKNQAGDLFPVALNVAPVAEERSFVKGVAVTIIDISMEKELQRVKDEFVYVVAHELGNPIFALDGYLGLLKGHTQKINCEGREILQTSIEINKQLSSLVNDLLEVARNETGRLTFDLEKIEINKILEAVIKDNSFKAKEKNIKLSSRISKLPKVIGNERKIREVLTNLVDNAIKYTPQKGAVHADAYLHENKVIISIADNGIGLSAENQKHLFEKFFRVKSRETEGISGTGLGLFIAKQIVEKCGGKMWAKSEEGKGSTFYISLRAAK